MYSTFLPALNASLKLTPPGLNCTPYTAAVASAVAARLSPCSPRPLLKMSARAPSVVRRKHKARKLDCGRLLTCLYFRSLWGPSMAICTIAVLSFLCGLNLHALVCACAWSSCSSFHSGSAVHRCFIHLHLCMFLLFLLCLFCVFNIVCAA